MTSTCSTIWTPIYQSYDYVLINVKNSTETWTVKSACSSCIRAFSWDTWYVKKASYRIQKKFSYCSHAYTKNTQGHSSFQWHGPLLPMFHQGFCFHYGSHYQSIMKDKSFWMDDRVPTSLGKNQATLHGCIDLDFTPKGHWVSNSQICFQFGNQGYVGIEPY